MKRVLGTMALASTVMLVVPAFGADMAYKAAPSPVRMADSWSGFYIGGNVGYGAGRSQFDGSVTFLPASTAAGLINRTSGDRSLTGVIGGGQIGYNWQVGPSWVFGIEADYQGSDQKFHSSAITNVFAANGSVQTQTTLAQEKLDWFGTVRGRLGYVVGNSLFYGTGGYAYGKLVLTESENRGPGAPGLGALSGSGTASETKTGYTVGGGIETNLGGNWSTKVEYLYMDLGRMGNAYTIFNSAGTAVRNTASNSEFKDHIFRVGLNYKFGGAGY